MKPIVLYASKGGNTRKIAEEIAQELSCNSLKVTKVGLASSFDLDSHDLILLEQASFMAIPTKIW